MDHRTFAHAARRWHARGIPERSCSVWSVGLQVLATVTAMKARLADIAAHADVSEATVSRVLNGKPGVAEATRQAVLTVARRARLRPAVPAAAQDRRPRRPDRARADQPDLPGLRAGHRDGAGPAPVHPGAVHPDARRRARGRLRADAARPRRRRASSSSPASTPTSPTDPEPLHQRCASAGCRSCWSTATSEGIDAPFISNDDVASMELAVTHLVQLGHTQIGLAVGPERFVPVIRKIARASAQSMRTPARPRRRRRADRAHAVLGRGRRHGGARGCSTRAAPRSSAAPT